VNKKLSLSENHQGNHAVLLGAVLFLLFTVTATAEVELVDGRAVPAEVLFEHPNSPLLILRSPTHATVQTLPKAMVHSYLLDGKRVGVNPKRILTPSEAQALERNGLWGDVVGAGQLGLYGKQEWERHGRLIVWAKPGESGSGLEPGNWLDETGRPLLVSPWAPVEGGKVGGKQATTAAFDGDVLLPAADSAYKVIQPGNRDHLGAHRVRHLTIESGASYEIRYEIAGNLWVKDGAELGRGTQTGGLGGGNDRNTFARFCNFHDLPEPKIGHAEEISHWVLVDVGENGSIEIIGVSGGAGDRLTHARGTLILSTDSFIGNGNRGSFYTQAGSTTVMLDGSGMGCPRTTVTSNLGTYGIGGTLMFGHPDKPLTRDLIFSANLFPYEGRAPNASPSQRTRGASYVLSETGKMITHSSDPRKARVVFRPRSKELPDPVVPDWHGHFVPDAKRAANPALWEQPDMPNGLTAVFLGKTEFDGVVFEGFYRGGMFVNPEDVKAWRNVTWADGNQGTPEQLVAWPSKTVPSVKIEPDGGMIKKGESFAVALHSLVDDLPVRYTTDGTVPDRNSPLFSGPLTVDSTTRVTAAVFKDGFIYGLTASADFRIEEALNIAPNAKITASDSFGGRSPAQAIDLNESTSWRGGGKAPQHLDLEWDAPVKIARIEITGTNINAWSLQVENGGVWNDIAQGSAGPPIAIDLKPIETKKLRFLITEKSGDRPVVNEIVVRPAD
jgi:hypothetical protein